MNKLLFRPVHKLYCQLLPYGIILHSKTAGIQRFSASALQRKLTQTAAVFIITSVISLGILSKTSPIVWEDHFQIGKNLRSTGALTIDGCPSVFRPPGYPGFVAASLWIGDAISNLRNLPAERSTQHDLYIVVTAQSILLGAMASVIFFWATLWGNFILAASIAAAAVLNPYSLALANLASYHLLFVAFAIFSILGQFLLRGSSPSTRLIALGIGLLWGLTSLIRPTTLVIPFFIIVLMLFRCPIRHAIKSSGWILVGLILIVGPYVGRNYLITGQPIVTAQGGFAFWGSSVEKMGPNEAFLDWQPLWWKYGMPIFSRVTGSTEYSELLLNTYAIQLNAEFSKEARQNIIATPKIYLFNVLHNYVFFNLDTMEFWNKYFIVDNKALVHTLSQIWIVCLMIMAATGSIWGGIKNDDNALIVIIVYLGIVIAHSISFASQLYTIGKLPLIILGFALLMRQLAIRPGYEVLASIVACSMAGFGLLISILSVI